MNQTGADHIFVPPLRDWYYLSQELTLNVTDKYSNPDSGPRVINIVSCIIFCFTCIP